MGVGVLGDAVEHTEEVFARHLFLFGHHLAVAATMLTTEIAPQGALPEQLIERMLNGKVFL